MRKSTPGARGKSAICSSTCKRSHARSAPDPAPRILTATVAMARAAHQPHGAPCTSAIAAQRGDVTIFISAGSYLARAKNFDEASPSSGGGELGHVGDRGGAARAARAAGRRGRDGQPDRHKVPGATDSRSAAPTCDAADVVRARWVAPSARGPACVLALLALVASHAACGGRSRSERGSAGSPGGSAGSAAGALAGNAPGGANTAGGSGSGTAGACAGPLRFELTSAAAGSYCWDGCALYQSLRDSAGNDVRWRGCNSPDCATCEGPRCPGPICGGSPFAAEGYVFDWDGTLFEADSCGSGSACWAHRCAEPGRYHVKFCAEVKLDDGSCSALGGGNDRCAELDFDYPNSSVSVVIP
jgi:hypothetical protein